MNHLKCEGKEIIIINEATLEHKGSEYLVLTDEEAYNLAEKFIWATAWTMSSDLLAKHSNVASKQVFDALKKLDDESNEAIKCLIDDLNLFASSLMIEKGRGAFISTLDDNEFEMNGFYIYKMN